MNKLKHMGELSELDLCRFNHLRVHLQCEYSSKQLFRLCFAKPDLNLRSTWTHVECKLVLQGPPEAKHNHQRNKTATVLPLVTYKLVVHMLSQLFFFK